MSTIGFLGVGAMGSRMAMNLIRAGHTVRVYNRSSIKATPLHEQGAIVVQTPKEAAEEADFVISMVRDDAASKEVWLHSTDGAFQGIHQDAIAIECSTLSPAWIQELYTYSKERCYFLESPVIGTLPQAEAGSLISFVGGDKSIFQQARAVLVVNAKTMHHVGEIGSAAVCKLAINAQYSAQVAILAETLQLVKNYGLNILEDEALLSTLPTFSPALQVASKLIAQRNFRPMFPIELVAKDLEYALQAARSSGLHSPMMEAVRKQYQAAVDLGLGGDNIVAVAKLYAEESTL
ncbi:NAD(P)-dependent oxidoreductase [Paenibacillus sp. YYML68]|uniref:NAD(P)-dependent oxidoreductase n=1 Tax=Paenibacillus sp. YYML68 TaxID=2909250 RepID=UPI00248FCE39|nr:NAD(P)-dependent oxidoreductase [Paenibacillus sp. YYML68]